MRMCSLKTEYERLVMNSSCFVQAAHSSMVSFIIGTNPEIMYLDSVKTTFSDQLTGGGIFDYKLLYTHGLSLIHAVI